MGGVKRVGGGLEDRVRGGLGGETIDGRKKSGRLKDDMRSLVGERGREGR